MNFEDTITIPKPKKGATRGLISERAAAASLARGLKAVGDGLGFPIEVDDPRFGVIATRREGGKAIVIYGARGRKLDATQLAYELNN